MTESYTNRLFQIHCRTTGLSYYGITDSKAQHFNPIATYCIANQRDSDYYYLLARSVMRHGLVTHSTYWTNIEGTYEYCREQQLAVMASEETLNESREDERFTCKECGCRYPRRERHTKEVCDNYMGDLTLEEVQDRFNRNDPEARMGH